MEIAFLIRIKERVGQHGLECEAFAMSAADAICAERGDELILALSVVCFHTDFCGSGSNPSRGWDWDYILKKNCGSKLNKPLSPSVRPP